jgi:hypothetical protein
MKTFGGTRQAAEPQAFELKYNDANDEPQVFAGKIRPRASGGDIAAIMQAVRTAPQQTVTRVVRLLTKVMHNRDALVPAEWSPEALERKDDDDRPASYRGPDGEIYAFTDEEAEAEFADHKNWTTRRRWIHLMEEDDEAEVELDDLMEIVEWVIGQATDRPTRPRA